MSAYINMDDYNGLITDISLTQLISNTPNLLDQMEAIALDEITPYLSAYDTNALFITKTVENHTIKMRVMDIVLYHLHSRIPSKGLSTLRTERYEQAMDYFKNIHNGLIIPKLPVLPINTNSADSFSTFGSSNSKNNFYY